MLWDVWIWWDLSETHLTINTDNAPDLHGTLFDFIYRFFFFFLSISYFIWNELITAKGGSRAGKMAGGLWWCLMEWMFTLNSQVLIYYFMFWRRSEQVCEHEPQSRRQNKYCFFFFFFFFLLSKATFDKLAQQVKQMASTLFAAQFQVP